MYIYIERFDSFEDPNRVNESETRANILFSANPCTCFLAGAEWRGIARRRAAPHSLPQVPPTLDAHPG